MAARWCGACGAALTPPAARAAGDGRTAGADGGADRGVEGGVDGGGDRGARHGEDAGLARRRGAVLALLGALVVVAVVLRAGGPAAAPVDLSLRLDDLTGRSWSGPPPDALDVLWTRSLPVGSRLLAAQRPRPAGIDALQIGGVVVSEDARVLATLPGGWTPSPDGRAAGLVDGMLVVLDAVTGDVRGRHPAADRARGVLGWAGDVVLLRTGGGLAGVSAVDGSEVWTLPGAALVRPLGDGWSHVERDGDGPGPDAGIALDGRTGRTVVVPWLGAAFRAVAVGDLLVGSVPTGADAGVVGRAAFDLAEARARWRTPGDPWLDEVVAVEDATVTFVGQERGTVRRVTLDVADGQLLDSAGLPAGVEDAVGGGPVALAVGAGLVVSVRDDVVRATSDDGRAWSAVVPDAQAIAVVGGVVVVEQLLVRGGGAPVDRRVTLLDVGDGRVRGVVPGAVLGDGTITGGGWALGGVLDGAVAVRPTLADGADGADLGGRVLGGGPGGLESVRWHDVRSGDELGRTTLLGPYGGSGRLTDVVLLGTLPGADGVPVPLLLAARGTGAQLLTPDGPVDLDLGRPPTDAAQSFDTVTLLGDTEELAGAVAGSGWIALPADGGTLLTGLPVVPAPAGADRAPVTGRLTATTGLAGVGGLLVERSADLPGQLVGHDGTSGALLWRGSDDLPATARGPLARPTVLAAAATPLVVVGEVAALAVDRVDGSTVWQAGLTGRRGAPAVLRDDLLVVAEGRRVVGRDASDGTVRWERVLDDPATAMTGAGEHVVLGTASGAVLVLDGAGTVVTRGRAGDATVTGVLVHDDTVLVVLADGTLAGLGVLVGRG